MSTHRPHFPVAILTHQGGLIIAAGLATPAVAARLPAGYLAAANTLCTKVAADVTNLPSATSLFYRLMQ